MDAQLKEPHLQDFLLFLVCRCNHRPMSQCGMATITRSSSHSWREPGDVHCQSGCWVPIYRWEITWNPWPQGQVATECVDSLLLHNTTVEPSRRELAWQLRTRGNGLCVRAPARLALVMRSHSFSSWRGLHACVVVLRSSQELHALSTLVSNWWAVYVLNNVFTFQRRWPVLRTLAVTQISD